MANKSAITKLPHHVQQKLCHTRAPYRQGKRLTSVKVYTVNDESQHLMICGVPNLHLSAEVEKLVSPYGEVKKIHVIPEYPTEEFTEAYHVQYARIQSARIAKRFVDGKNFYGGSLHVFYAPELESVSETRAKLNQRKREITIRIRKNQQDNLNPELDKFVPKEQYHRKKKTPALPLTEDRLTQTYPGKTLSSIYNGIPREIDPRPVSEPSLPSTSYSNYGSYLSASEPFQAPYQHTEDIIKAAEDKAPKSPSNSRSEKKRNYKGQPISNNTKVRVVRPQIIDTSRIVKWDSSEKHIFSNAKKSENSITIKLMPRSNNENKKIVIKNPSIKQLIQPSEDLQLSIQSAKCQIRAAMQTRDVTKP